MASAIWISFDKVKDLAEKLTETATAEKVDAILASIAETIADILPSAPAPLLREGALRAKAALEAVERAGLVDEESTSFAAGKLAAAVDVLGYAAAQTADDNVLQTLQSQPYALIADALSEAPMRNVDLAVQLGKDEAQISKWLSTLREMGAVTSHKRGRDKYNALTPIGRLAVEKGIEDDQRMALGAANVCTMDAYRPYNLNDITPPDDIESGEIPRLMTA